MKKTLAALAVLGAFAAGSVYAADVQLYGIVDLGLKYTHNDTDEKGVDATDKLEMASGMQSGSRFGLKGTEDLGNGYKVGFVLENGFNGDDGTLGNDGRLFGREAQVNLSGAFGEISFGRVGQLTSGNGSYGITGNLSPFGTSWAGSVEGSTFMVGYGRMDNTITYKSPEFAGVRIYAQYSFDGNTKDEWSDDYTLSNKETVVGTLTGSEGKASATRYAALGATYGIGGLKMVATVDWYNWSNAWAKDYVGTTKTDGKWVSDGDVDDGYAVTLGGSYDFQVVKAYLGAQYYDNMIANSSNADEAIDFAKIGFGTDYQFKGYSVMAGVDAPLFGGTAMFAAGYADVEATDPDDGDPTPEMTRWGVAAGYTYALSKRTNIYGVAAWYQDNFDNEEYTDANDKQDFRDRDPSTATLFVGMRHSF